MPWLDTNDENKIHEYYTTKTELENINYIAQTIINTQFLERMIFVNKQFDVFEEIEKVRIELKYDINKIFILYYLIYRDPYTLMILLNKVYNLLSIYYMMEVLIEMMT